ncbi:hypothetical protein [Nocardia grenadensis]|uniref:hypothetical protein n=1 Tax=Nocardia grenadensis TaxID=931537 RepID=UPI0007A4375B|nr:hypothetical protein [Nocardia grenadensis]
MAFDLVPPIGDRAEGYRQLTAQAAALLYGEADRIANAANPSALIYHSLTEVNRAGIGRRGLRAVAVRRLNRTGLYCRTG